jgi:hypothetical protein
LLNGAKQSAVQRTFSMTFGYQMSHDSRDRARHRIRTSPVITLVMDQSRQVLERQLLILSTERFDIVPHLIGDTSNVGGVNAYVKEVPSIGV